MDSDTEPPTKLQMRLAGLMRPLGRDATLQVSQIAFILGLEGDAYQQLLDLLARSRFFHYDAEKQTVQSLFDLKDIPEDQDEAALLALSDVDMSGSGGRSFGAPAPPLIGGYRQGRSNSRHGLRNTSGGAANSGGVGACASGYRSDSGLMPSSTSLHLLSRRRLGGAWTKPGQRGVEEAARYPGPAGRVGYICVADELHLGKLEAYYRAQGYYTKFDFDVLHVRFAPPPSVSIDEDLEDNADTRTGLLDRERSRHATNAQRFSSPITAHRGTGGSSTPPALVRQASVATQQGNEYTCASPLGHVMRKKGLITGVSTRRAASLAGEGGEAAAAAAATSASGNSPLHYFDLFIFPYGAVVWWGFDQRYFKIVESDYMLPHSEISHCMTNRYTTKLVNENYPVWCTFNLVCRDTLEVDEDFKTRLRFDHFVIPYKRGEVATGSVLMLCASHALAQSAKIDYLELQVQELTESCSPLPRELREKGTVSITERRLLRLRGEVLSYRLMLKSGSDLLDEPDFFWENSYLKPVFQATKEEYEISARVEALDNKLDAANEILSMLAEDFSQRHGARLEWIVIWLVFVEVVIGVLELLVDVRPWFQSSPH